MAEILPVDASVLKSYAAWLNWFRSLDAELADAIGYELSAASECYYHRMERVDEEQAAALEYVEAYVKFLESKVEDIPALATYFEYAAA